MKLIVAKILRTYRYGYRKLEEETAFPNEMDGLQWLKEEFFNSEFNNEDFTGELVQYEMDENSDKISSSLRKFSYSGKEVSQEEDPESNIEPPYDFGFIPKFAQGDLIVFRELASIGEKTFRDSLAVVTGVPLTYAERKSRGMRSEDLDYTDQMYMLEYITACGKLEHAHILEEDMVPYEGQVPEELKALEYLTLHFNGTRPIDDDVLLSMMKGEIYMLNRKNWREVLSQTR